MNFQDMELMKKIKKKARRYNMPAISKIRFTNVVYDNGSKRYNDSTFQFDGLNGAFLLENGGGKTVFIQMALQAVIPQINMADRKVKDTLSLDGNPAHIAIEWIINEKPRRYLVTAVSLYMENNVLKSYKYVYEYSGGEVGHIEDIPFALKTKNNKKRPSSRGEISEYYSKMQSQYLNAHIFNTAKEYGKYLEENYKIIPNEWRKIALINSSEGNVDAFFDGCKTTQQLLNNLLIPTVEEALQGEVVTDFASTFEKQRNHFKLNKQLSEEIEQFKRIKKELDIYIGDYKVLHEIETEYIKSKLDMKALQLHVMELQKVCEEKQDVLKNKYLVLEQDEKQYDYKKKSYEIRMKEHEIETIENKMTGLKQEYDEVFKKLCEVERRKQNIEISKLKEQITSSKLQIERYYVQLKNLEKTVEIREGEKELSQIEKKIKGYFVTQIEKTNNFLEKVREQLKRDYFEQKTLETKLIDIQDKEICLSQEIGGMTGEIKAYKDQMQTIETEILNTLNNERMGDMQKFWKQRLNSLEADKQSNQNRRKEIQIKIQNIEKTLDENSKDKESFLNTLIRSQTQLKEITNAQKALIFEIERNGFRLFVSENIYIKEDSIKNQIDEKKIKIQTIYEKALESERSQMRLADMYKKNQCFCADPQIERKIEQIQSEVHFIEHGTRYIETMKKILGVDETYLFEKYPYWTISVITTESDLEKVKSYLKKYQAEWMYPVLVLTIDEIKAYIEAEKEDIHFFENAIFPHTWRDNLNKAYFENWKAQIIEQAEKSREERLEIQKEHDILSGLFKKVNCFFKEHPFEYFKKLKIDMDEAEKNIEKCGKQKNALESQIEKLKGEDKRIIQLLENINEEILDFSRKLDKSYVYGRVKGKLENTTMHLFSKKNKMKLLKQDKSICENKLKNQMEVCKELENEQNTHKMRISNLKEDIWYKRVDGQEPLFDMLDYKVLKQEWETLSNRLKGIDLDRESKQELIKREKERLSQIVLDLELKISEAKYPIEEMTFYDVSELPGLIEMIKKMVGKVDESKKKVDRQNEKYIRVEALKMELEKGLLKSFERIFEFKEDLGKVNVFLKKEKDILEERSLNLKKEMQENQLEQKQLMESWNEIRIQEGKHNFGSLHISNLEYDKSGLIDFVYSQERILKEYIKKLDALQFKDIEKRKQIRKAKENYVFICRKIIKDPKIREVAIGGVEKKTKYAELLEYQNQMNTILERNIRMVEEDRRESDMELQTFLTHLIAYIKNVTMELDGIQKKTKIKIGTETKQIFIFDVPKWDDYEAKNELRRYIQETIILFDEKQEKEKMDGEGLRLLLEKKLSVKNLIQVVLKDKVIRIKCRKVTNDMTINHMPMTWESSNRWSGGEKWSKNMTLFLGLLNYLAERKQYLSTEEKKNRTVILDNPFGKASSEHVLAPVFFVAEKLGFQIIALTAHAEGKFISDYFPVVYSGRLRSTQDSDKQIIENERILNSAYLKAVSPESIWRMEETEQLRFLK